jgi:hypothetical protein
MVKVMLGRHALASAERKAQIIAEGLLDFVDGRSQCGLLAVRSINQTGSIAMRTTA